LCPPPLPPPPKTVLYSCLCFSSATEDGFILVFVSLALPPLPKEWALEDIKLPGQEEIDAARANIDIPEIHIKDILGLVNAAKLLVLPDADGYKKTQYFLALANKVALVVEILSSVPAISSLVGWFILQMSQFRGQDAESKHRSTVYKGLDTIVRPLNLKFGTKWPLPHFDMFRAHCDSLEEEITDEFPRFNEAGKIVTRKRKGDRAAYDEARTLFFRLSTMSGLNELVSERFFGKAAEHIVAYTTMAQHQVFRDVDGDFKEGRRQTDQYAAYAITWFDHVFAQNIAGFVSTCEYHALEHASQTFRVLYLLAYELSTHTTTSTTAFKGAALSAYERFMSNVHAHFTAFLEKEPHKLKTKPDYNARTRAAALLLLYGQKDLFSKTYPGYKR